VWTAKTYVTPVSNEENCNNMGYTFRSLTVIEGADAFAFPNHVGFLFCDIHVGQDILPFVLFAKEEFVGDGESKSATPANEPNEGHVAL